MAYPRNDPYIIGHGYSVSAADLKTVNYIDQEAADKSYVVLANQAVAAAAIQELGFKKYFPQMPINTNGYEFTNNHLSESAPTTDKESNLNSSTVSNNIFFYPIPTGGPLYQIYLQMVYQLPLRETAQKASQLTGAKIVYLVVNRYWERAAEIIEIAQETADKYAIINGGQVYVFKYSFWSLINTNLKLIKTNSPSVIASDWKE